MSPQPDPPRAERRAHLLARPGGEVDDPWFWLADRSDPTVLANLTEENRWADAWFAPRAGLIEEIFGEIKARTKEDDQSPPVRLGAYWYSSRTEAGAAYPIHCRGVDAAAAGEQVILDENAEAASHDYFALGGFEIGPSGNLLAWASDIDGSERYTCRVRRLAAPGSADTHAESADVLEGVSEAGLAWSADERHLFYVTHDAAMRPDTVWRHELGTEQSADTMVFHEPDERFYVGVGDTRSRRWIVIHAASKTTSEVLLVDAHQPTSQARVVRPREDGVDYAVDDWGDRLAILTNLDAQDFRVCTAPAESPGDWTEFVPHRPGARITGFECFADFAVMSRWAEAQQCVEIVGRDGGVRPVRIADGPHEVELESNPEWESDEIRIVWQSPVVAPTVAAVDAVTLALRTLKITEVPGADLSRYVAERLWAEADDGTAVPLDVVRARDTPVDGTAPGLLYVYGAYEISVAPWFSAARLSLLDRGWVWALAHPRGGGEMGRDWYEKGRLLHKKNTFGDTIACARHLARTALVAPDKLAIRGGSAGGLCVAACVTASPETFAAMVAEVPFVDVVTTMSDPSLPLTVTEWEEWGDPREEPWASYIASYSPYDNLAARPYPPMMVTAGLNDPRVSYHEPAKFVAKVRHLSPETPVVFTCEMDAGHGGPSGRYDRWREEARTLAFLTSLPFTGWRPPETVPR